jgi:protein-S-isoprenylcysteine O-methyltransferase Ste14
MSEARDQQPADQAPWRQPGPIRGSGGAAVLGGLLVVLGIVFLAAQYFSFDIGRYGWPVYVIGPGLALMLLGLTQRHGSGLTIGGSVITITGLVLLYQTFTDHWESWAYAWALVGPGGSGLGMLLYGTRARNGGLARAGLWQIVVAVGLFAAGFVFFEGILGISGRRFPIPEWVMPVVVILLGLALLIRGFTARPDAHHDESDEPMWRSRGQGEPPQP